MRHCIILVPGFLGFQRLGEFAYFVDVEEILRREAEAAGVDAEVRVVKTLPTSSLAARAARLAEVVSEVDEDMVVHLAGHSTGGLDARLFLSPGTTLPTRVDIDAAAARVRSLVTVATPHWGAPLATYFTGVQGHRLMGLVSVVVTQILRHGKSSLGAAWKVGKFVLMLDRIAGVHSKARDSLGRQLSAGLAEVGELERSSVESLLGEMGEDSSLLEHLTPTSLELFNAATHDRSTARYGCVVAMAPSPRLGEVLRHGLRPLDHASHALYAAAHRLTATATPRKRDPLTPEQRACLTRGFGRLPTNADSDGLVPTLSQVWGDIVAAVQADHFDLMGWYGGRPGNHDLFQSGPFDAPAFARTWRAVARYALLPEK